MVYYDEGTGNHMLSQMQYSLEYLKRNLEGKTQQELENYLSKPITPALEHVLRRNERISYDSETRLYRFRPIYNVRSAPQLLALLSAQTVSQGLIVKDLKEGWPTCYEELDRLEAEGQVLLIRNRKDDRPKTVWPSSLEDATNIDKEFIDIYLDSAIPGRDQLPRELESLGLKPTSVDPMTVVHKKPGDASKQKKPKARRHKVTNTHMGTLKDLGMRNPKK
ncbi:TFA2 protein [Protomyces lactucae-debilis]|uniref:TFA2 protein n=1 Tax=Protomyces lactucae-debilis TaxID=2754530 RepID=A0A1Y2FBU8_PROLT|nr:TFA2 protein [Protomyces lactucae-debilis]ORY81392.1 TFA2 protein [Protomyces lactucae-debilis]